MYHSRAAALLSGDYADRVINAASSVNVPNGTGDTIGITYTVGGNIRARLETSHVLVVSSAAADQVVSYVEVTRGGVTVIVNRVNSIVASQNHKQEAHDIILFAGDTVRWHYLNSDGVAHIAQAAFGVREIDL